MDDVLNVGATEVPCMSYGHLMRMEVGRGRLPVRKESGYVICV